MRDQPATPKLNRYNRINRNTGDLPAPSGQRVLFDIGVKVERRIGGIEMGVLENGIPYLTQRGLSAIAGVARSTIQDITKEWEREFEDQHIDPGTRIGFLKDQLFNSGYDEPELYLEIRKNNSPHYAYPDVVCMAIIEFFAFEAQNTNEKALKNFRRLAKHGLQKFIYEALNYTPEDKWRYFNDRVSILKDRAPNGHFTVFNEVSGLIIDLINSSLSVNDKTIPDASVGIHWGKYWSDNGLNEVFGKRVRWDHHYPEYYPQSVSNPQEAWAYPDAALPSFRHWFRVTYLPTKFPGYILRKAHQLKGGEREALAIAGIYERKSLDSTAR